MKALFAARPLFFQHLDLVADEFFENRDWPVASAVAIAMLVLLVVPIVIFQRYQNRELAHR